MVDNNFFHPVKVFRRKIEYKLRKKISLYPKKTSGKRAVVSYIVHPFIVSRYELDHVLHTNSLECLGIVEVLLNAGYMVDVIDWRNTKWTPKKKYDVLIDVHQNIDRLKNVLPKECVKIFYITGAHFAFQNTAEEKRLAELRSRRGISLSPRRHMNTSHNIEYCDFAVAVGSEFAKNTYAYAKKEIFSISLPWNILFDSPEGKNFELIKKNFVWIGGGGAVHKGLDVVLECFAKLPEYNLTVCGPVKSERDFFEEYKKELTETPSVHMVGRIDLRSEKFKDIAKTSIALIYPSCSEGQSGSVIAAASAGLIPLVSYESGVDILDFGYILTEHSPEYIKAKVLELSNKPIIELKRQSIAAWTYVRANHSYNKYTSRFESILKEKKLI